MKPIEFTEEQIIKRANRLAPVDGRILPKNGKGAEYRTGRCVRCGRKCYPYSTCRMHREHGSIRRVIHKLVESGEVIRVTDGRGKKGGATYREANFKKLEPYVRRDMKQGRNELCRCGSGKKYKKCCMASTF